MSTGASGERRRAIIDAALALMAETGAAPGLREVGAEVGISHAGVLYHFADKHELLVEMLAASDRTVGDRFEALFAAGGLVAIGRLSSFAEQLVERPELGRLFLVTVASQLERDDPPHRYVVERYRVLRRLFADAIRTGQERGEIRTDVDADTKAAEIHAFLDGVALQALVAPDDIDVPAVFASYQRGLLDELTA